MASSHGTTFFRVRVQQRFGLATGGSTHKERREIGKVGAITQMKSPLFVKLIYESIKIYLKYVTEV